MDERLEQAANNGRTALVAMHASHDAAVFDISAASVVRNALANQEESLLYRALGVVFQVNDGRAVARHNISCS